MNKGFTITCNNCGNKIDAISGASLSGKDIGIVVLNSHWYDMVRTEIECDCGNTDKDDMK